jgi:hypothetical protein
MISRALTDFAIITNLLVALSCNLVVNVKSTLREFSFLCSADGSRSNIFDPPPRFCYTPHPWLPLDLDYSTPIVPALAYMLLVLATKIHLDLGPGLRRAIRTGVWLAFDHQDCCLPFFEWAVCKMVDYAWTFDDTLLQDLFPFLVEWQSDSTKPSQQCFLTPIILINWSDKQEPSLYTFHLVGKSSLTWRYSFNVA